MIEIREYIQVRRFFLVIILLLSFTLLRFFAVYYVSQNEVENTIFNKIADGVTIQTINADNQWADKYPYDTNALEKLEDKISGKKKVLQAYCVGGFPGATIINEVISALEMKVLDFNIDTDSKEYGDALYVEQAQENVVALKDFCVSVDIPFAYFSTPCPDNTAFYNNDLEKIDNFTIINRSHALVNGIRLSGVNTTVIAEEAASDNNIIEFDASNHWFAKDALYTARLISDKLNQEYGFDIDVSVFNSDNYENILERYPDIKEKIELNMGYEYEFLVPQKSNDFVMTYAEGYATYTGNFEEVFLKSVDDWNLEGGAYHSMTIISNSTIYDICNESPTVCDKKVLIIGDSSNWPVAMYLSQGVKEVIVIHNASFTGSIETYIKVTNPDAVLMVYNDAEFYEIYTEDAFDLR